MANSPADLWGLIPLFYLPLPMYLQPPTAMANIAQVEHEIVLLVKTFQRLGSPGPHGQQLKFGLLFKVCDWGQGL